ncbi:MAG: potassium transporter KefB [Gammaproteobacteria bacterium]|nr:potassium transporter KefB [Gammaproteobacteria bacterium]
MHDFEQLNQVLILLFFSVISVAVFRKINLPSVLGYLLVGMLAGHHALGLISESHAIEQIAEIGVVFLLFTIGLEVSIPKLMSMKSIVFGIGLAQVLITTMATMGLAIWLGMSWQAAFAVGGALSLSSTAIVVKQLNEQHELHSRHGHIALGVLLFQDLAVVPFLVLIPIFAVPESDGLLIPISIALLKGAFAFSVIYVVGTYLIRPVTHWVSSTASSELFTLFILLITLLAASLTWQLGLSLAMGAFLAGIMLAETEFLHQVQTEIRPFKDVLMGLFFISVGTQFDPHVLIKEPLAVFLLTTLLILGKGLAVTIIAKLSGNDKGVSIRSGLSLGQGSEFGFALLGVSLSTGLLTLEVSQPIIAAIVFSMSLSPMIIRHNGRIAKKLSPDYLAQQKQNDALIEKAADHISDHIIICGFGRTGQNLSQFLKQVNIPFIALELDSELIKENWDAGEPVYYGDSSHPEVLQHAGIDHARAIIITFHDFNISHHITRTIKQLHINLPIIVRTRDDLHLEELLDMGATEVIPDTVESSIMLAWHALTHIGVDKSVVDDMISQARSDHYFRIRAFFHSQEDYEHPEHFNHLHSIEILSGSPSIGRQIDSFEFNEHVYVIALIRNNIRCDQPELQTVLKANDVLIVEGPTNETRAAELEIYRGKN